MFDFHDYGRKCNSFDLPWISMGFLKDQCRNSFDGMERQFEQSSQGQLVVSYLVARGPTALASPTFAPSGVLK